MNRIATLSLWLAAAGVAGALALAPVTAHAQAADAAAEKFRLTSEMKRLAQRNAWAGVESKYEELLGLGVDLEFDTHTLAAQSAKYLGKTYEVYRRLERAASIQEDADVAAEMEAIDSKYGRVRLVGNERWEVTLTRPAMPFAPDERKSVEYAIMVALESGGFEGMLPQGAYVIGKEGKDTLEFTVEPGPEWQEIVITKNLVSSSEGLIVYHGPVGLVGYSFAGTAAPGEPTFLPDGTTHQAEPDGKNGSGVAFEAGYELGFTREFAVAVTFDYRNLITGADQFHGYTGFLAFLLRPGKLRVGAGPVFGRWAGQGSGVADWYDVGQDPNEYPTSGITYDGQSWAAGGKLVASYGLLEFDPFDGVVELNGFFQTDGDRPFYGGGLRVGIVPQVPRFRE